MHDPRTLYRAAAVSQGCFSRGSQLISGCAERTPTPCSSPLTGEGHTPTWTRHQVLDRRQRVKLLRDKFLFGERGRKEDRNTHRF